MDIEPLFKWSGPQLSAHSDMVFNHRQHLGAIHPPFWELQCQRPRTTICTLQTINSTPPVMDSRQTSPDNWIIEGRLELTHESMPMHIFGCNLMPVILPDKFKPDVIQFGQ